MDEHELRFKVVDMARLFIGAKQGSADHKLIVDTYNSHQPLAQITGMDSVKQNAEKIMSFLRPNHSAS